MELHLEPFDLLDSFRGWNDSFRMALLKKHIAFSFEASPDTDFRMMADAEKMERIYFNLFSNAVKYTPENGKIAIRLSMTEQNYSLSVSIPAVTFLRPMWKLSSSVFIKWTDIRQVPVSALRWYVLL